MKDLGSQYIYLQERRGQIGRSPSSAQEQLVLCMSNFGEHSKSREGFYGVLGSQACQLRVLSRAWVT